MKIVTTTQRATQQRATHMVRTVFLVDGFNLYHSLREAQQASGQTLKSLDLRAFCSAYLPVIAERAGGRAQLERLYHFSAAPTHLSRKVQEDHKRYVRCLRETGVNIEEGRFKRKSVGCTCCGQQSTKFEEKETDVAIATRLFEVCHSDGADAVVLITGDTDLAPAVRTCKRLFPEKLILFAFPYKRFNRELKEIAPESFLIKRQSYINHQFPNQLVLPNGASVAKPRVAGRGKKKPLGRNPRGPLEPQFNGG